MTNMYTSRLSVIIAAVLLCTSTTFLCEARSKKAYEFESLYKDLPFSMEKVSRPNIPANEVNLRDFDAMGDGVFDNSKAFADAINALAKKGGGSLIVPSGIWLTGPIELKSKTNLHLEFGAIILFDSNRDLYPIIQTSFEGLETYRCESPIHAENAHDIAITGQGVIDGNGQDWRACKKSKLTSSQWKALIAKGGYLNEKKNCWYPSEAYYRAEQMADMNVPPKSLSMSELEEIKDFLRPVMISIRNCQNVLLEGCTFQNSPSWNIHPLMCTNLIVKDITVRNPWYSQNGDGIDIESCTNTIVTGCSFDVGDDGICIKSGKDEDGRRRAIPTKGLIVDNCVVYHGHGGFVVGSEMSGGVEDVKVSNCCFLGTDVGLRFKSKRGRGGVVRNIYIENINMTEIVTEALLFDLHYGGKSAVEALEEGASKDKKAAQNIPVADETTPAFRDIYIKDVVCSGARRAMYFNGIPEMPVKNINISNCVVRSKIGVEINHSEEIRLDKVSIFPEEGEAFIFGEVKELYINDQKVK